MSPRVQAALEAASQSALLAFGNEFQKVQAVEEMGELIRVLAKDINKRSVTKEEIIDEVADVIIMSNQLRIIFGEDAVDAQILVKLDKLMTKVRSRTQSVLTATAHEDFKKGDVAVFDPSTGAVTKPKEGNA